jgi:hypothetical protein
MQCVGTYQFRDTPRATTFTGKLVTGDFTKQVPGSNLAGLSATLTSALFAVLFSFSRRMLGWYLTTHHNRLLLNPYFIAINDHIPVSLVAKRT